MPVSFPKRNSTPSKLPYSAKQSSLKRNTSILNFFQKTEAPTSTQPRITQFTSKAERINGGTQSKGRNAGREGNPGAGSLFLEDSTGAVVGSQKEEEVEVLEDTDGFLVKLDGEGVPIKKRRASLESVQSLVGEDDEEGRARSPVPSGENGERTKRRKGDSSPLAGREKGEEPRSSNKSTSVKSRQSGPFIDESDNEDEDLGAFQDVDESAAVSAPGQFDKRQHSAVDVPPLVREATSHAEDDDELANFDDLEENDFREEEFLEPLCDEESEQPLGAGLDELIRSDVPGEESTVACPVCQASLAGSGEMVRFMSLCMIRCLTNLVRRFPCMSTNALTIYPGQLHPKAEMNL